MRIYANYVSVDGKLSRSLNDDLAKDPHGIAYVAGPMSFARDKALPPELKLIEVAAMPGGPYFAYTMDNLRERVYPLYDEIYAYADHVPGQEIDPKVKEYLRFIVSREGQAEVMRDGKYLPLTAKVVKEQLKKLD